MNPVNYCEIYSMYLSLVVSSVSVHSNNSESKTQRPGPSRSSARGPAPARARRAPRAAPRRAKNQTLAGCRRGAARCSPSGSPRCRPAPRTCAHAKHRMHLYVYLQILHYWVLSINELFWRRKLSIKKIWPLNPNSWPTEGALEWA